MGWKDLNGITEYDVHQFLSKINGNNIFNDNDVVISAFILSCVRTVRGPMIELTGDILTHDPITMEPSGMEAVLHYAASKYPEPSTLVYSAGLTLRLYCVTKSEHETVEGYCCGKEVKSNDEFIKIANEQIEIKNILRTLKICPSDGFYEMCIDLFFSNFHGCTASYIDKYVTTLEPKTELQFLIQSLVLGSNYMFSVARGMKPFSITIGNEESDEYVYSYQFKPDVESVSNLLGISDADIKQSVDAALAEFKTTLPEGLSDRLNRDYLCYLYIYYNERFKTGNNTGNVTKFDKVTEIRKEDACLLKSSIGYMNPSLFSEYLDKLINKFEIPVNKLQTEYAKALLVVYNAHVKMHVNNNDMPDGFRNIDFVGYVKDRDLQVIRETCTDSEFNQTTSLEIALFYSKNMKEIFRKLSVCGVLIGYIWSLALALAKKNKL